MFKELTLKQVIQLYPKAVRIMERYSIDYMNYGMDTFEEAALINGLNPKTLVDEIVY